MFSTMLIQLVKMVLVLTLTTLGLVSMLIVDVGAAKMTPDLVLIVRDQIWPSAGQLLPERGLSYVCGSLQSLHH